jgi:hypothetical protein
VPVWPSITEPELLARLAMDHDELCAFVRSWGEQIGPRAYAAELLERATGYPWSRPERSYLLTGAEIELLDDLTPPRRQAVLQRFTAGAGPAARRPLLAIGSNAAPSVLTLKFAHFPDAEDRAVLALTGHLCDFDVGAAAYTTLYGAMPATLFPSPGTAARTAVLWVTGNQFTQLAWSEVSYHLGWLETPFEADEVVLSLDGVLAFVSRFGTFCRDGRPVALAAVPARRRTAAALSQEELLDAAAQLALGPGATAETLVRAIFEDATAISPKVAATVHRAAESFASDRWTPFPLPAAGA